MRIWTREFSVEAFQRIHAGTAPEHLGMELLEVGDDHIKGRMPVDHRTRQPYGILHGGISVVLAETLGSMGGAYSVPEGYRVVGLDINANHLRGVADGWVIGTARPVHRGRSTQVWQIDITDEAGRPTCVSRLTLAVLQA